MRIEELRLRNYRCYEKAEFHFSGGFNLIIGDNGAGKTTVLEGLADALGLWHTSIPQYGWRNISTENIRRAWVGPRDAGTLEQQFPVEVEVTGLIAGNRIKWTRGIYKGKRTSNKFAQNAQGLIGSLEKYARWDQGKEVILPLLAYYGDGRLHLDRQVRASGTKRSPAKLSRFEGNRNSLDSRIAGKDFVQWIARQEWIAFQEKHENPVYLAVKKAIIQCLDGGESFSFDARREQIIVGMRGKHQLPLDALSAGQKTVVMMIGDIARRAALLNPHLGSSCVRETSGVVLIDELDLHLHPRWQRRIVSDLRKTFPKLQFFCTTHSPQIVGEVPRDCVYVLKHRGSKSAPIGYADTAVVGYGSDSSWILEHVMDAPERSDEPQKTVRRIEDAVETGSLDKARKELDKLKADVGPEERQVSRLEASIRNLEVLADAKD